MKPSIFILLAFAATVSAGPVNWRQNEGSQCATRCSDSTRVNYAPGKTYQFRYSAETVTALQGAAEELSGLHITSFVDIEVISKCEMVLNMQRVNLEATNRDPRNRETVEGAVEFRRALERNPLRFSFQDGRIEELCPAENEPEWVLNIKRGLLTAFQNSMDQFESDQHVDETDVSGNCKAEYTITDRSFNTITVRKNKNLLGCTERQGQLTALQSTAYRVPSEVQSLPVLNSNHSCVITLGKDGTLKKSECEEMHVFRPFSKQGNGAKTHTMQTLEFVREQASGRSERAPVSRRTNMLFEHKYAGVKEIDSRREALTIIAELCRAAENDIRPEVPALFARLVYKLRDLNAVSLRATYDEVVSRKMCRQFFLDAIPMLGNSASAHLIKDLIVDKTVTGLESDAWLTSLAFAKEPTVEMLREVKVILQQPQVDRAAYLSISALLNTFCKNNANCGRIRDVLDITNIFESNLNGNCNRGDREKILISLKAIGNAGIAVNAIPVLNKCAMTKENPIEIRLAAMDAFRRLPCGPRDSLISIVRNTEEDSEIRIAAYLAVMQCPSAETISTLKAILEQEEVNQVGSFIWTHLTNLMETSDLHKQNVKMILEDAALKKEFDMDKRKFSRNIEKSVFFESINTGAKVESNLVWSSKSFIPRSAMLNLTVDLFGSSMNLLEVGGRIEGMEYLMERYFGPMGVFGSENLKKMAKEKKVNFDGKLNNDDLSAPVGSAFFKIFGNELGFVTSEDLKVKGTKTFLDILIELAEGKTMDFSKSMILLDTSLIMPTMVGLPMNLTINATASVNVKVGGKLDIRTLPKNVNIDGHIKPSGAVEVSSMMGVDAFVAKSGIKMTSTMHSSTAMEGKIMIKNGQLISVEFKMPKEQMEVLDVKSKFFVLHRGEEREQRMITDGRTEITKCTGPTMAKISGLELCGQLSLPKMVSEGSPIFPMTGPAAIKLTLNKRDTHTSYVFDASMEKEKDKKNMPTYTTRVAFNTPGSKIDRDMSVELILSEGAKTASLALRSPWTSLNANGAFVNSKSLKKIQLSLVLDKKTTYSMLSEVAIVSRPIAINLKPTFELRLPGRQPMSLTGTLNYKKNSNVAIDLKMANVFKKPVAVKGNIAIDRKPKATKFTSNIQLNTPWVVSKFQGFAEAKTNGIYRSRIIAFYNLGKKQERATFNFKLREMNTKATKKINMNGNLALTQFPDYNVQATWDLLVNMKHAENTVDVRYGRNPKDFSKRVYLSQVFNHVKSGVNRKIDCNMKLRSKSLGLDFSAKMNHKNTNKELKTDAIVEYMPNRKIVVDLSLKNENTAKLLKMSGDVKLAIPRREMRLSSSLVENTPNVFNHEVTVQWAKGSEASAVSQYKKTSGNTHSFSSDISVARMAPISLSFGTRLVPKDFSTDAKVVYGSKSYSANAAYKYAWGRTKSFEGKVDLKHPVRQLTAAANGKLGADDFSGNVEMKWDASRDANKKIQINGAYNLQSNKLEGRLNFSSPFEHFEHLNLGVGASYSRNKYNGAVEFGWATRKQVQVALEVGVINGWRAVNTDLTISTPFAGFNTITAKSNHRLESDEVVATFDASVNRQKSQLVINGQKTRNGFSGDVSFTSPSQVLRSLNFKTNNAITSRYLTSKSELAWNSNKIEMSVMGKNEGDDYKNNVMGSISVKTPFRGYESMSIAAKHEDDRRTFASNLEGKLNKKTAGLKFNMVHSRGTNQGKLQLITPDREEKAITWQHRLTATNINSRTEVTVGSSNAFLNIQGMFQSLNMMSSSMQLKTPFSFLRDISFKMNHELSQSDLKHTTEVVYNRNQKVHVSIEGSASEGKFLFTSPVKNLEHIAASYNAETQKRPYTGHAEFSWTPSKTISLDGSFSAYGARRVEATYTLMTPFESFRKQALTINHGKKQSTWVSSATLEYAANQKIEMETEFQTEGAYKASFDIKTPCSYFRTFHIEGDFDTSRGVRSEFAVLYNGLERVAFEGSYKGYGIRRINGNVKLSSSFQHFEQLSLTLAHNLRGDVYTSEVDFEYQPRRKIEVKTTFQSDDIIAASIDIKTPMRELSSFKADFKHEGSIFNAFGGNLNLDVVGKQRIGFATKWSAIPRDLYVDGFVKFTSPFANFEKLQLTLKNGQKSSVWETLAAFEYGHGRKIEAKSSFQNAGALKGDIEFTTPFNMIRSLSAQFEHGGNFPRFFTKGTFNFRGYSEASFDGSLNVGGLSYVNGNMKFTGILNDMEASIKHGKNGNDWNTRANLQYSGKTIQLVNKFSNEDKIALNFNLQTPYRSFRMLEGEFEHDGSFPSFTTKSKVTFTGHHTISIEENISINGLRSVNGFVLFKSPFTNFEEIKMSVNHGKKQNTWNSRAVFMYQPRREVVLETTFNNDEGLRGSVSIETPIEQFRSLHASFDHNGNLNNFRTTGSFDVQPSLGRLTMETKFRKRAYLIEGGIKITTPYSGYNEIKADFSHREQSESRYSSKASVGAQGKFITISSNVQTLSLEDFNADISFTSPFEKFEHLRLAASHKGDMRRFNNHIEAEFTRSDKIVLESAFSNLDDISATVKLQTPWRAANFDAEFNFAGELHNRFTSQVLVKYGGKKVQINADMTIVPEIVGTVKFVSPFEGLEDITLSLNHRGSLDNFNSEVSLKYAARKQITFAATFKNTGTILGKVSLTTPFRNYENLQASFNHEGRLNNFKSSGEVIYGRNQKIQASAMFRNGRSLVAKGSLKTPFHQMRDLDVTLKHAGSLMNFKTEAEAKYNREAYQATAEFNGENTVSGKATLRTPIRNFENMALSFEHEGNLNNFKCSGKVQLSPRRSIVGGIEFSNGDSITGKASLTTPFAGFEAMSASFNHRGNLNRFRSSAEINYPSNKKISGSVQMNRASGSASLSTPYFKDMSASFNHQGSLRNFQSDAEATYGSQKISAAVELNTERNIVGKLSMKTPFYRFEDMALNINHRGNMRNFHVDAVATYGSKRISGVVELNTERNIKGKLSLQTPFYNVEDMTLNINHEGSLRNFKADAEATYGRQKFSGAAELNTESNIMAKLSLKTPFYNFEDMALNINHQGSLRNFKVNGEAIYGSEKFSMEAELNTEGNIVGKLSVKTPFSEDMTLNVQHQGSLRRFNSQASFQYSPRDKIEAVANFANYGTTVTGKLIVKTPFRNFQKNIVTYRHEGSMEDFKASSSIDNSLSGKYQVDVEYKAPGGIPSQGSVTYNCPNHAEKKISFTNARKGDKYVSSGIYSWASNKQVRINTQLGVRGDWYNMAADGEVKMTTPYPYARNIRLAVNHQHANMRFLKHSIQFDKNNQKQLDMDVDLRNDAQITGSAKMRVPYPMAADFDVRNTNSEFTGNAKLNWNTQNKYSNVEINIGHKDESNRYRTKRSINVKTITPVRTMALSTEMDKSRYSLQHKSEFAWDLARNKKVSYDVNFSDRSRASNKNYNMVAKINTPVRDMELKWSHKGDGKKFDSNAEMKWDASRDASRKLNLKSTYENNGHQHSSLITIKHPRMQKEWSIRSSATIHPTLYSGKSEVEYSTDPRKKIVLTGKVQDVSGSGNNYTMEMALVHPHSSMDINMISHIGKTEKYLSAATNLNYLTTQRRKVNVALRGAIDKLRKSMNLEMTTPLKTIQMNGKMSGNRNNGYKLSLINTYDNTKTIQSVLALNPRQNNFDMKLGYDAENPGNMLQLTGKMVNGKAVQLEALRHHNNKRVSEGLVSFKLNNTHLLHSHVHWMPSSYRQAKYHGQRKINEVSGHAKHTWETVKNAVAGEIRSRSRNFVAPDMRSLNSYLDSEMESLSRDVQMIGNSLKAMYGRDEFYLKSTSRAATWVTGMTIHAVVQSFTDIKTNIEDLIHQNRHKMIEMKEAYDRMLVKAIALSKESYAEAQKMAINFLEQAAYDLTPYFEAYYDFYNRVSKKTSDILDEVEEISKAILKKVTSHPVYKKASYRLRQHAAKLSKIDFLRPIKNTRLQTYAKKHFNRFRYMLNSKTNMMNRKVNNMAEQYSTAIYDARDKVVAHLNNMDFERFNYLKDYATQGINKAAWAFEHYEVERNAIESYNEVVRVLKKFLLANAYEVTNAALKFDKTRMIMWDPKKGEVQFEVYVPTKLPSLKPFPSFDYKKHIQEAKDWINARIPDTDFSIWDTYYQYKPTTDITNWIPPFKAVGTLTGLQHFMTFDKRYFEFAGECSYTLAKDMVDNNFTVTVKYADSKKSLSLTTDDKTFEISSDKAMFENREVDLPFAYKGTVMTLTGSAINIISNKGVKVVCNMEYDVCTVELSGWYFGKTAGLLGTYDNEPSNDFTTQAGAVVQNFDQFARSWESSKRCRRNVNIARTFPENAESQTAIACAELFKNKYSALRPCFKIVDPTPFYRMCINDMEMMLNSAEFKTSMCKTAAFYKSVCKREGVFMNMPTTCVRCNTPEYGHFTEGEKITVETAPTSADVVFVVEEKECNNAVGAKLGQLAWQIETFLKTKGFNQNQFGLVGFGGNAIVEGVHSRSIKGKIMGDARQFHASIRGLTYSDGADNNALEALRYAAMYPFRTGVSKTIVLVTCGACTEQDVKFSAIETLLQDRDITLHYMTEHHFKMNADIKSPKSNYIFGVDDQAAFTRKDVSDEELVGDEALFRQLQMPQDKCAALAQGNKGSVFNSNKFTSGHVNTQKSFMDVFAKRVATIETSECQVCECVHNRWGVGKSICRSCVAPTKE